MNFYERKIRFERAPEPEDIIFENLEISYKTKLKNIICVSIVSLILCGVGFYINEFIYLIQLRREESKGQNDKNNIIDIFSIIITIVTTVIDLILEIVLEKIIKWEKSYTLTNFNATYSINLTFFGF